MKNNYKILVDNNSGNIPIIFKSLFVGAAAGGVAVLYRITLTYAEKSAFSMYEFAGNNLRLLPLLFMGLCLAAYFVGFLVSKNRMIAGSGIPQLKGILSGYFSDRRNWLQTLGCKFLGGAIAIAGGLSLGREGPSIQLGACMAEGIGKEVAKSRLERKILMASGASAGLAAAFNAPMAGVVFAFEEIFKYFSPVIMLSTMSAAIAADFISKSVFGLKPVFHFDVVRAIPLSHYGTLVILGAVMGVMGAFYNFMLLESQKIYGKVKFLDARTKIIIPFVIAGILGITFPIVLGGGHRIIEELNPERGIWFFVAVFIVKFLFSMVSFGSGAPGGIFFPLLVLGAAVGAVFAGVSIQFFGVESELFYNFVILAMAGYFTAIVRAPITGIVLIMEMTGSFTHMLSLTVVSVSSYVAADLLKSPPVYDALLDRLIVKELKSEEKEDCRKILIELVARHGSKFENCIVSQIEWPEKTLLVGIKRGEREILPKGKTQIKAGDYLFVLADINEETRIREILDEMNGVS